LPACAQRLTGSTEPDMGGRDQGRRTITSHRFGGGRP
jgi:hypothetical protein